MNPRQSCLTWLLRLVQVRLVEEQRINDGIAHLVREDLCHLEPAQHARHVEHTRGPAQAPVPCKQSNSEYKPIRVRTKCNLTNLLTLSYI